MIIILHGTNQGKRWAMVCDGIPIANTFTKKPDGRIYYEPPVESDEFRPDPAEVCESWCKSNGIQCDAKIKQREEGKKPNTHYAESTYTGNGPRKAYNFRSGRFLL